MAYVQLSSDTTAVAGVFGGPQPDNPAVSQIDDADPRLLAFLTPAPPPTITAADFLNRFTPAEQAAVQTAASANAQVGLGLTMGLAQGFIILTSPILASWMGALVAAGAITSNRSIAIMTP